MLKNKCIASYIHLGAAVLAIVLAILGATTLGLVRDTFSGLIIVLLLMGAVASLAAFVFGKIDWLDIIPIAFYGLSLGFIFKDGIEVLTYASIGIDNNTGGNAAMTNAYLIIGAVLLIASVVKAFIQPKKA